MCHALSGTGASGWRQRATGRSARVGPISRSAFAQREKNAAGIAAAADYERLTAPRESLLEFFRNSPLAEAMAEGELDLERDSTNIIW
jgi:hypothetical protein